MSAHLAHKQIDGDFAGEAEMLLPRITQLNAPYWNALEDGTLMVQSCAQCARPRLPVSPVCPYCGGLEFGWRKTNGLGVIFSWVRYHRRYLPEFENLLPYYVANIELEAGPRLFARLLNFEEEPRIGEPVELVIERWHGGRCVPVFQKRG